MRVIYSLNTAAETSAHLGPVALAVDFFDGVHRGHRRLVERAAELARAHGVRPVAVTFWPHPHAVAYPQTSEGLLSTLEEKLDLLTALDAVDTTVVIASTPELAALPPEQFLDRLAASFEPVAMIAGTDVAPGANHDQDRDHDSADDRALLMAAGQRRGWTVERVDVRDGDERITSARIRALVREGRIEDAARLLGRPYRLAGEVVKGDQRGRLLGFPTANLHIDERKTLPANGVYAVRVRLPGEAQATHAGVANVGVRPTFSGEHRLLVEVHLLDAAMDLYGLELGADLVARLREERRFDGVEALKAQIGRDAQMARERLAAGEQSTGTAADAGDRSETPWA
jgi:riboflavin kinase/FMN adenylyltransferase